MQVVFKSTTNFGEAYYHLRRSCRRNVRCLQMMTLRLFRCFFFLLIRITKRFLFRCLYINYILEFNGSPDKWQRHAHLVSFENWDLLKLIYFRYATSRLNKFTRIIFRFIYLWYWKPNNRQIHFVASITWKIDIVSSQLTTL